MIREDAYLETKVMTAPSHQLHLMVIDGAIRFAKQAETALEANDFETSHFSLDKCRDFVTELISGLDEEKLPEVVEKLKGLFMFVYTNLVEADQNQDINKLRDALKILIMHRETWLLLIEKLIEENQLDSLGTSAAPKSTSWST